MGILFNVPIKVNWFSLNYDLAIYIDNIKKYLLNILQQNKLDLI